MSGMKLFQSQEDVVEKLLAHYKAAMLVSPVAGFSIRPTALLLGPSGVGKSVVARHLAEKAKVPIFETSLSAWTPTNSSATSSGKKATVEEYVEFFDSHAVALLEKKRRMVVFVDEVDKLSQLASDNSNWCSFVWSEIMRMIDGRLAEFGIKQEAADAAHSATYFVFAGAFQKLWEKKTCKIGFVEQVDEAKVSHEHLSRAGILPKELLNRICGVTCTVYPPTLEEVCDRLRQIEDTFFMDRDSTDLERDARAILDSGHLVRGIEQHFTRLACDMFLPSQHVDTDYWGPTHPDDYEEEVKARKKKTKKVAEA